MFEIDYIQVEVTGYVVKLKRCVNYASFVSFSASYVEQYLLSSMSIQTIENLSAFTSFMNKMSLKERIEYLEKLIEPLKCVNKFNL